MRLRAYRRPLFRRSPFERHDAAGFTGLVRPRRIRRCVRVAALLTIIGTMHLARGGRSRWRPLLAGAVLTVLGVMMHASWWILVPIATMLFAYPLVVPARSDADRERRYELERQLQVYSIAVEVHSVVLPP
jgi:hypothetical protein